MELIIGSSLAQVTGRSAIRETEYIVSGDASVTLLFLMIVNSHYVYSNVVSIV